MIFLDIYSNKLILTDIKFILLQFLTLKCPDPINKFVM